MVALVLIYLARPDWAQWLHWWPMAIWTPFVLIPLLSRQVKLAFRRQVVCLAGWIFLVFVMGEPSWRVVLPPMKREPGWNRVVSLNCAAGSIEAAEEAFGLGADIVLLQEVSSKSEFRAAAERFGYRQIVWAVDDAIYLRQSDSFELLGNPVSGRDFASCEIRIGESKWRVISLRLAPPVFRLDWWNPACWSEYSEDAKKRRARIVEIRREAGLLDNQTGELIGGDFNTTHPGMMDLNDVGRKAGRGWMGTGTNDFPLARVDQLWSSDSLIWHQAFVVKTKNSDHRMLIADFSVAR